MSSNHSGHLSSRRLFSRGIMPRNRQRLYSNHNNHNHSHSGGNNSLNNNGPNNANRSEAVRSNMNNRDRISPHYNGNIGPNSSRPASTSTYDIKSDSPSRKRRRVSSRQSPTSSWEHRQSPRSSQNHGHPQHSPLLRRRLRDMQPSQRSWEPVSCHFYTLFDDFIFSMSFHV